MAPFFESLKKVCLTEENWRMKVLIYSHFFAPSVGGVEKHVLLLAEGLAALRDRWSGDVTVTTPTPAKNFDDLKLPFPVVRQPSFRRLLKLVNEADIIQLTGPSLLPLLIAWLKRKPIIIEQHTYPPVCPNGLLVQEPAKNICPGYFLAQDYLECLRCTAVTDGRFASLRALLLTFPRRWLCQQADVNVPVTQHVLDRLKLPRSRVIYLGVPENSGPATPPLHAIQAAAENHLCFAFVGRFVSQKGLPLILQATKTLQAAGYNFRVKFVGDGPERAELEAQAAQLGVQGRVQFTGFLTGNLFQAALEEVSVALMPSVCEETAGLAAIEQMMRGKLVIASNIGGLGEVVDDCGLLIPAGDVGALTECMRMVLDHPEIVARKGEAAKQRARNCFSQQRMVKEHIGLYAELLSPDGDIGNRTPATGLANR